MPSVKRVVTIGTPHRGSEFANDAVRELSRRLIHLPEMMLELGNEAVAHQSGLLHATKIC